jgi:uncharacterized surface protein with fasciclin (FAS1) repeats
VKRFMMIAILMMGLALVAVACDDDDDDAAEAPEVGTIVEVAEENGFTTLVAAVDAAGLTETLSGEGPFTVFAPTDEAFDALPEGTLDSLLADQAALTDVLTYHVVGDDLKAADVVELDSVETVQGSSISISVDDEGTVTLDDTATVTATDVEASNGTIHVIDAVLTPAG